jgi:DNA-binding NarL/FixJ family response regulator
MPRRGIISVEHLGERRRRVALLLADGYTDKSIAAQLGMAQATVRKHLWYLGQQLAVASDKDARLVIVRWVIESQQACPTPSTVCPPQSAHM